MGTNPIRGKIFPSSHQSVYVSDAELDDRGRLTIPKELRERYGERFYLIEQHDGIKLVPIAENPLTALREEFDGVDASSEDLLEEAREDALEEAGR